MKNTHLKSKMNVTYFDADRYSDLPGEVDWRTKGAVSEVKNQVINDNSQRECRVGKRKETESKDTAC